MNTWMDTREKVFAYIKEHQMLQPGDRVVAGVSGGADSVCLLFLLLEWRREFPLDIAVVFRQDVQYPVFAPAPL